MNALTHIDERHAIGANGPPDPYDAHRANIDDLYVEAGNWADGAEIENEAQAAVVDRLIDDFKEAIAAVEASQDEEIRPLTEKVTKVRERYYPLIGDTKKITGKAIRAKKALLEVKTLWGRKVAERQRIEADRLRAEATEAARVASEAAVAAHGDLQASEQAEELIRAAQATLKAAARAEKPTVSGMRDNWVATMADPVAAARWAWADHRPECEAFFLQLAQTDVRCGKRQLSGFTVTNERRAV